MCVKCKNMMFYGIKLTNNNGMADNTKTKINRGDNVEVQA